MLLLVLYVRWWVFSLLFFFHSLLFISYVHFASLKSMVYIWYNVHLFIYIVLMRNNNINMKAERKKAHTNSHRKQQITNWFTQKEKKRETVKRKTWKTSFQRTINACWMFSDRINVRAVRFRYKFSFLCVCGKVNDKMASKICDSDSMARKITNETNQGTAPSPATATTVKKN